MKKTWQTPRRVQETFWAKFKHTYAIVFIDMAAPPKFQVARPIKGVQVMRLQEKLDAYKKCFLETAPPEAAAVMHRATEDLANSGN